MHGAGRDRTRAAVAWCGAQPSLAQLAQLAFDAVTVASAAGSGAPSDREPRAR